MRLSKKTKDAAREGWERMADEAIQKRINAELGALVELLVSAYIVQNSPGATVDDVQRARLESTALLGEIDHEAMQVATWCVTGVEKPAFRKRSKNSS